MIYCLVGILSWNELFTGASFRSAPVKSLTTYLVHVSHEKSFLYISIYLLQFSYILSNQGKYDELNVVGSVHPGLVIICALGQVTCIRQVSFESEKNSN